jgi:hypothetical protein
LTGQDKTSNNNCTETAKQMFHPSLQREEDGDGKILSYTLQRNDTGHFFGFFSCQRRTHDAHQAAAA